MEELRMVAKDSRFCFCLGRKFMSMTVFIVVCVLHSLTVWFFSIPVLYTVFLWAEWSSSSGIIFLILLLLHLAFVSVALMQMWNHWKHNHHDWEKNCWQEEENRYLVLLLIYCVVFHWWNVDNIGTFWSSQSHPFKWQRENLTCTTATNAQTYMGTIRII